MPTEKLCAHPYGSMLRLGADQASIKNERGARQVKNKKEVY